MFNYFQKRYHIKILKKNELENIVKTLWNKPEREKTIEKWLASKNIWLQKSDILFQLKYKKDLDTEFLSYVINSLLGSKEFFINKAIGWILRDYSRINPTWVIDFIKKTELSNLSRREALRLIK